MIRSNGVYLIELGLFIPTASYDEARNIALKISAETGESRIIFG